MTCAKGTAAYPQIFYQRQTAGQTTVSILVDRRQSLLHIDDVPLTRFSLAMLADMYLPFFLLGMGFLAIAAVVFRAAPREEINLVFATLCTAMAGFMLDQFSALRLSSRFPEAWGLSLILQGLWLPFMGALIVHLIALITTPSGLSLRARRGLRIYYGLSALVSVAILLTYMITNQSLNRVLTGFSLLFCTVSSAAALTWGILRLGQVYRTPPSLSLIHI